jgi:hypothetical protein
MAKLQFIVNVRIAICDVSNDHASPPDVLPDVSNDGCCPENLITSQESQTCGLHNFFDDVFIVAVERVAKGPKTKQSLSSIFGR